jgi:hypothetical protein
MKIIAHRANISGPDCKRENRIFAIEECINLKLDVEIDLRFNQGQFYLGHDEIQEKIDIEWLNKYQDYLWIHCKDFDSLNKLRGTNLNYFWHNVDMFTLTSKQFIWTFPNNIVDINSVIVCQNFYETTKYSNTKAYAVCSDWKKT